METLVNQEISPKGLSDDIFRNLVFKLLKPMKKGRLTFTLPDGRQFSFGRGQSEITADIKVLNHAFFRKCILFGDIGFAESYMDGDWETESIAVVIEWMILNVEHHPTLMFHRQKHNPVNFLKWLNKISHKLRPNSIKGSRRNIQDHYDLGNNFFQLFLDPSMTYSSAFFQNPDDSLLQAQYNKFEKFCQKLRLKATDHVLEIGCGWGGFATHVAKNYGCHVTGITISKEQFEYATTRIKREKLGDKVTIKLEDYRTPRGKFDKIISIEMIEAVGHEYYISFFKQAHNLLKEDGLLGMQMILAPDGRYKSFRRTTDFIQKHIFPGSLLPSFSILQQTMNKTGNLCLYNYEDITSHYVITLNAWAKRFEENGAYIKALGLSERFMRKWRYYFYYCAAAFKTRNISVAQAVFTRPNNSRICC